MKFGTGSVAGSLTSAEFAIPSVYSTVKLHFKAAAWNGSSELTTLSISADNADIKDGEDEAVTSVTTAKGEWTTYDYFIKNVKGDVTLTFSAPNATNNRFFLDDVLVYYGVNLPKVDAELSFAVTEVAKSYGDASFTNALTNPHGVTVSYTSSDTSVATVNSSTGEVTIVKPGTTRITASFAGEGDYNSGSAYYDLTVSKAETGLAYAVTSVSKSLSDANFTNTLTNPHSLSVSYSSSNTGVATVNASTGEVSIVAGGSTTITASFTTNDYYLAGEASYTLTVKKAIKTMAFASASVDVDKDDSVALPILTIEDINDDDISGSVTVTYSSSNTSIAEEDSGEVLGYAAGHVTLTASITGNAEYEDKSTTLDVFVLGTLAAPTGVTLTTLNKESLVASWTTALGAESYSWGLVNTSTSEVAKSGTTVGTSLELDYSASNIPVGTYKLSVVSTLSSPHAGVNNSSAGESVAKTVTNDSYLTINFEEENTSSYTDWVFDNFTTHQTHASVTAHGGSYFGTTGGKASGSVKTANKIANPVSITCYVTRQSSNTKTSTWYIKVSSDGSDWTEVESKSATSMGQGVWSEFTVDLSSYNDVYVGLFYSGSTAVRDVDDLILTYE
ncbi:MAG: Ig-like domain-containing protein [Prevotella sp.]|nr:Ig-like domain-containing protein [Prevotella sp.]